ncbi:PREDICTED: X-ray radiation resistance-associated protein 1-like, partial [Nanorana parkeri]|uniref:X-ray radiation resistance-associated protein 1-like n=1 Tax=Nanorana parkeri TaxID=125878 RepID=UPI0008540564
MAAAPYKMEAGGVHTSNCFPARSVFRTGHGGAGRWLLSQKTPQGRDIRMVVCSASSEEKSRSEVAHMSHRRSSCPPERRRRPPNSVLDSQFLVKVHHVKDPSDLCAVDVSDKHLTAARTEEFVRFNNVAYINAAENALAL